MSTENIITNDKQFEKEIGAKKNLAEIYPISGVAGVLEWLNVNRLRIDIEYQRQLRSWHIRDIARNFNWNAVKPLNISLRNGIYYVIDGQHLCEAAKLRGDIKKLPAYITVEATQKNEAKAWDMINSNRLHVSAVEKHIAKIIAGDEFACRVRDIYEKHGLAIVRDSSGIGKRRSPNHFACIAAFYRIENSLDDLGGLDYLLGIMRAAWKPYYEIWTHNFVEGMAMMLYAANGSVSEKVITDRLRRFSPSDIIDEAAADYKAQKGMALNRITAIKLANRHDKGSRKYLITPLLLATPKTGLTRMNLDDKKRKQ